MAVKVNLMKTWQNECARRRIVINFTLIFIETCSITALHFNLSNCLPSSFSTSSGLGPWKSISHTEFMEISNLLNLHPCKNSDTALSGSSMRLLDGKIKFIRSKTVSLLDSVVSVTKCDFKWAQVDVWQCVVEQNIEGKLLSLQTCRFGNEIYGGCRWDALKQ